MYSRIIYNVYLWYKNKYISPHESFVNAKKKSTN